MQTKTKLCVKTQKAKTSLIKRIANIVAIVSVSKLVRLVFVTNTLGATDGKTVKLRLGDFNDPHYVKLIIGLAYHEASHIAVTRIDRTLFNNNRYLHCVWNALEDVRIEQWVKRKFIGAIQYLTYVVTDILGDKACQNDIAKMDNQALLHDFALYWGRGFHNADICCQYNANLYADELVKRTSVDMVTKAKAIIAKVDDAKNSTDALDIAKEFLQLFGEDGSTNDADDDSNEDSNDDSNGDSDGKPDDNPNEDSNDDSNGDSDGKSDDNPNEDSNDDSNGDSDGNTDDNPNEDSNDDSNGDSDGKSDDKPNEDSNDSDNDQAGGNSSKSPLLKDFDEKRDLPDFHDRLKEEIDQKADDAPKDAVNDPMLKNLLSEMNALDESNVYRSSRSVDVELAKRNTNRLKLAFRKLLMDVAKVKSKHFDCGASLDGNRLVDIITNPKNAKPFRDISRAKTPNAAVSLIVDASKSMDYQNRFIKANTAALSIANALEPLRHVDVEVRHMYADNVFVTKPFSKKAEPLKFGVTTSGCTPTALVVGSAITSLMSLQKDRRMIIVITDGDANSISDLEDMVDTASMLGIEVKAIGIGVDSVSGIPNHCVINNVNELGTTLEGAVKTGLF